MKSTREDSSCPGCCLFAVQLLKLNSYTSALLSLKEIRFESIWTILRKQNKPTCPTCPHLSTTASITNTQSIKATISRGVIGALTINQYGSTYINRLTFPPRIVTHPFGMERIKSQSEFSSSPLNHYGGSRLKERNRV